MFPAFAVDDNCEGHSTSIISRLIEASRESPVTCSSPAIICYISPTIIHLPTANYINSKSAGCVNVQSEERVLPSCEYEQQVHPTLGCCPMARRFPAGLVARPQRNEVAAAFCPKKKEKNIITKR